MGGFYHYRMDVYTPFQHTFMFKQLVKRILHLMTHLTASVWYDTNIHDAVLFNYWTFFPFNLFPLYFSASVCQGILLFINPHHPFLKMSSVCCLMSSSLSMVKLTVGEWLDTEQTNKNIKRTRAFHTTAAMRGAILISIILW